MQWYHYFSDFWAGMFLANFVPHFVKGIAGDPFPTPFATPPGRGLSPPITNVFWALANLIVGYILFQFGRVSSQNYLSLLVFLLGVSCISVMLAKTFESKEKL
jgi:hypothetical protein